MADPKEAGISVAFPNARIVPDAGENPFTRFTASLPAPAENPFKQFSGPPNSYAGISFDRPEDEVRADTLKLEGEDRKKALDAWANYHVANESKFKTPAQSILHTINDYLETAVRGTPVGSWGDEIEGALKGAAYGLTGGTMGSPRDEAQAYARARQRAFDARNPKTSMALQLGGALATAPVTPGISAARGASMLGRMSAAGGTGMLYGAAYGAGLGEDGLASRLVEGGKGAAIGGSLGAVAAPVATGVSNAIKYGADKYRGIPGPLQGMERGAIDRVTRAMGDDGLYVGNQAHPPAPGGYAERAAQLGPEGMLADMGTNLRSQSQGITTQPSRGQQILVDAMEARNAGAAGRIAQDTTAVLGPARDLVASEAARTALAQAQAAPFYRAFYETQIPVNQTLVDLVQRVPQAAWAKTQQLAQAEGVDLARAINTGQGLDLIKRGLDDMARSAGRGTNEERVYSNLARAIRNEVDNLLSPGNPAASPWARARELSGEGFQYSEGVEAGRQAFSRGTHPDQLRADLAGMRGIERDAFLEGARGQIRDIMGNAATSQGEAGATAARRALGSEYARDKLRMILADPPGAAPRWGPGPDQLLRRLDAETAFANTRSLAYQGTQTAARTAAQKEFPNAATRREAADKLGTKTVSGLGLEAGYRIINALLGGALDAKNARISADAARLLSAQGIQRDVLARALMDYGRGRAITQRGRSALERLNTALVQTGRAPLISYFSNETAATGRR